MLPSLTDIGGFAATRGCTPCAAYAAIPAHPQKRHTRLWRLYHFCGFCYPIREVIPIAIYHWNIGIVSRGKGKSAVAAAAYRSGEKLTNEWDGMTHDYTRKGGVVHTEIMLPSHAPPSFSDRSILWNSVELYEKAGNAQLAREIDAALPIELSREEQIRLVREYCSSQFVSRGMCVDFAIHDTGKGNPHCHIMLTMRPLDERGAWAAKSRKEYDLDEKGERIRLPSGRYKTHKVDLTGWNDKGNALLWRKAWADLTNDFLERNGSPQRIDHRSNAERGIDEIPCLLYTSTYMDAQEVMHMTDYSKITALYSRLSVGDEDRDGGESNSIQNQELLCRGWFLPPNTYDCGSFVVNGTAVVGKELKHSITAGNQHTKELTFMKSLFEQMGGTYRQVGDYLIPNLSLPEKSDYQIGKYGRLRRNYLKEYHPVLYANFLTSGTLHRHLAEIDQACNERMEIIISDMAKQDGVTETLKVADQMEWVRRMNSIRSRAEEIVLTELVYE